MLVGVWIRNPSRRTNPGLAPDWIFTVLG